MERSDTTKSLRDIQIPISHILAKDASKRLISRLASIDRDQDGTINADELVELIKSDIEAKEKARRYSKISIVLFVLICVLLAANAGLTYAVVALSKDTSVTNNVLVTKDGSSTIATGRAMESRTSSNALQYLANLTPDQAMAVTAVAMPCVSEACSNENSTQIVRVNSVIIINPGQMVMVQAIDGRVLLVEPSFLQVFDNTTEATAFINKPVGDSRRRRHLLGDVPNITVYTDGTGTKPDDRGGTITKESTGSLTEEDLKFILRAATTKEEATSQSEKMKSATEDDKMRMWEMWKEMHGDWADTTGAEKDAKAEFDRTFSKMMDTNGDPTARSWSALNRFAVISPEMFEKLYIPQVDVATLKLDPESADCRKFESLPPGSKKDWVAAGFVTPVKDQGPCGSCALYAAAAYIEGRAIMKYPNVYNKENYDLSEANMAQCIPDPNGNPFSCSIGTEVETVWQYMISNWADTPIHQQANYNKFYNEMNGRCDRTREEGHQNALKTYDPWALGPGDWEKAFAEQRFKDELQIPYDNYRLLVPKTRLSPTDKIVITPSNCPTAMLQQLTKEPVAVSLHVYVDKWKDYGGGVITATECPPTTKANHAMLAVAFDTSSSNAEDHYITIKNSWGEWGATVGGSKGYVHLKLEADGEEGTCGMQKYGASYMTGPGPQIDPCYPLNGYTETSINKTASEWEVGETALEKSGCPASVLNAFKFQIGKDCANNDDCLSGNCANNVCGAKQDNGGPCTGNTACLSGRCSGGVCVGTKSCNNLCSKNYECVSSTCTNARCECV